MQFVSQHPLLRGKNIQEELDEGTANIIKLLCN
jgi:hypothetical protein